MSECSFSVTHNKSAVRRGSVTMLKLGEVLARMMKNDVAVSSAPGGRPADRLFEPFADAAFEGTVIERFRIIARRFASRIAIADAAISLTYAELAMLVDRIARAVIAATEGREGPVALLLPGDARLPAAMLGVLAAGRAYVLPGRTQRLNRFQGKPLRHPVNRKTQGARPRFGSTRPAGHRY